MLLRGVRSIDITASAVGRAADFYTRVWNLDRVDERDGSVWLRGSGAYHHILAIHPAVGEPAIRRITFDAKDRSAVDALREKVAAAGVKCEPPHALAQPGGGYGFGFHDPEGRNFAIVAEVEDHAAATPSPPDRPRKIAHVNINATDVLATNKFLHGVLGLKLIDETPALFFFHADSADHSCFVVCKASGPTVNHVAFELPDLDSVMRGVGRMRDNGFPIEWGVGRHGAGNNVFAYFAGPDEFPLEYTAEVLQIDGSYTPRGPDHWRFPPGRMDQWGVTSPHTPRWKRIQDMVRFTEHDYRLPRA